MEVIEVVDFEFVGDSTMEEASEAALDMEFGRVSVWRSVHKAWDMIVVT